MNNDLATLRKKIDHIDAEILALLQERMQHSIRVGNIKKENELLVFDEVREKELIQKLQKKAGKNLSPELIEAVWSTIMAESRHLQEAR